MLALHLEAPQSMSQLARRQIEGRFEILRRHEPDDETLTELEELIGALDRIAKGRWGRCEVCDDAIGRNRLCALPETRTCDRCR